MLKVFWKTENQKSVKIVLKILFDFEQPDAVVKGILYETYNRRNLEGKMKRKWIMFPAVILMAAFLSACGMGERIVSVFYSTSAQIENRLAGTKEKAQQEVVLGNDFPEDFDGFVYMSSAVLVTEDVEDGKDNCRELLVMIPDGDYSSVNQNEAYSERSGIKFRVSLNPAYTFLSGEGQKYSLEDDMEFFLSYMFDEFYNTYYKEIEISEMVRTDNGIRVTVKYLMHDTWLEKYIPVFCTYYLAELDKDTRVFVEVTLDAETVNGETDGLIEELEMFYGFDIEWDAEAAQKKLDKFLAGGGFEKNSFSTGYLMFELPEGWHQDYYYSDTANTFTFLPEEDAAGNVSCFINIRREYVGEGNIDIREMAEDTEQGKAIFKELFGDRAENVEVMDYGMTCLGYAIKLSYTVRGELSDERVEWYIIENKGYLYFIHASATAESTENVFGLVEDILHNGKVREE